MPIVSSAIASVTLAETVRYVRERSGEQDIADVVDIAAENTARAINEESEADVGIDSASIFAVIDTATTENLIEQSMSQGQVLDDDDLLQAVDCAVLDDSIDCVFLLEQFVKELEIQLVKNDKLGDVLQYSYLRAIISDTGEIISNQEEMKQMILDEMASDTDNIDIISDLNIPKIMDAKMAQIGINIRVAPEQGLLTDERIIESAIENDCGILTMDREFLSSREPYSQIENEVLEIEPTVTPPWFSDSSSVLLIGAAEEIQDKVVRALSH